jgi:hypothetical protein
LGPFRSFRLGNRPHPIGFAPPSDYSQAETVIVVSTPGQGLNRLGIRLGPPPGQKARTEAVGEDDGAASGGRRLRRPRIRLPGRPPLSRTSCRTSYPAGRIGRPAGAPGCAAPLSHVSTTTLMGSSGPSTLCERTRASERIGAEPLYRASVTVCSRATIWLIEAPPLSATAVRGSGWSLAFGRKPGRP